MPTSYVSTSIDGLDMILGGRGLPANRLYLLEGDPGTGKTTLALQFLMEGIRRGEGALYVALSETREELRVIAESHGWNLDGIDVYELAPEESLQPDAQYTVFHPSELELGATMKGFLDKVDRTRPARIVFDSLSEMRLLAGSALRYRRQILALKQFFAARGGTVLLLDDRTAEGPDLQLQSIAHGVVTLHTLAPEYGGARRRLRIMKVRGVDFQAGYHDYAIERGGLRVFPRLVAARHGQVFEEKTVTTGVAALDTLFGGGLVRGTTTLFLGPAGSGKSLVSTHIAGSAAARGENVAVYLFDEGLETFLRGGRGIGLDLAPLLEAGRITVQQVNPAELSPGQFVHVVRDAVERRGVSVVVIDSLNGYMNSMPEERLLVTHLHELFAYLRQCGVLTLAVMTQHGLVGNMQTTVDVSYLADTVVLLRYFEAQAAVRKAISMMKKRASKHETTIRELFISDRGIAVGEPLSQFRGVLSGIPEHLGGSATDGTAGR
ncbi:MAG TPA: ATPase domain-containing protein [Terriglobales bacterium]|nr:ATPase domain-containing protein [Terriglobales bacterium]